MHRRLPLQQELPRAYISQAPREICQRIPRSKNSRACPRTLPAPPPALGPPSCHKLDRVPSAHLVVSRCVVALSCCAVLSHCLASLWLGLITARGCKSASSVRRKSLPPAPDFPCGSLVQHNGASDCASNHGPRRAEPPAPKKSAP